MSIKKTKVDLCRTWESKKKRKTVMDEQFRFKTDKVVVDTATEDFYTTGVGL